MSSGVIGGVLVLAAAMLWSVLGMVIKTIPCSAVWMVLIRSVTAGIVLSPALVRRGVAPLKMVLATGLLMVTYIYTFVLATRLGNAAMAVSMQYAAPIFVIGFTVVKNKKVEVGKLLVMLLIFAGILLNVMDAMETAALPAVAAGLVCALAFAIYAYCVKGFTKGSPLGIVSATNFVCAGCCLMVLPFAYQPVPASASDIFALIIVGIVVSGGSYSLYASGLKRVSVESAMIITLAEPIFNPVWVLLFTGERPSAMAFGGLLFILSGVVVDVWFRLRVGRMRTI